MSYKRKTQNQTRSAILLVYCADRKGLIASVTEFIYRSNGNIIRLDQHVDSKKRIFFMRAEWDLNNTNLPVEELGVRFQSEIAEKFGMQWKLYFSDETPRGLCRTDSSFCAATVLLIPSDGTVAFRDTVSAGETLHTPVSPPRPSSQYVEKYQARRD